MELVERKLGMSELTQVLRHVLPVDDPNAFVGHTTGDDAAVYRLTDDRTGGNRRLLHAHSRRSIRLRRIVATNALGHIRNGGETTFVLNL